MWRRNSVFDELFDTFRDFDTVFRRTFHDARALPEGRRELMAGSRLLPGLSWTGDTSDWSFVPAVEWFTRGKDLVLRAELPGVDPSQVEVVLQGRQLTLRGEKKSAQETQQEGTLHYQEVVHGRFERTFTLPEGIQAEQVKASFTHGVLEISMPAEGVLPSTVKVPVTVDDGGSRKSIKAA
jgi:HSP20 family protein